MGILLLYKFYFGFAAVLHFVFHSTAVFFCWNETDAGRLQLVATIELLYAYPETGSSINTQQYYEAPFFHKAKLALFSK